MVLELARPSEARCFPPRQVIFSKLFYCSTRRQQKLSKNVVFPLGKCCFSRISDDTLGELFGVVLELARPSEAPCFPPAGDFFEAILLQQPQAILQQPQATEAVEKCCFSRISDDTLGSFLAWFWN